MRKLILQAAILAAIITGCILLCSPAKAGPAPLLFGAVGANGAWLTGTDAEWPADAEAQGTLWTSISPHIDLGGSAVYGFTHSYIRGEGFAKITATDVDNRDFNLYLKVSYRGGSVDALQPAEWAYGAGFGWCPAPIRFPRFLLVGDAATGVESQRIIAILGGRYYFPLTF